MSPFTEFSRHTGRGGLVVGFDGSDSGQRAIQWATAEAHLREHPLLLVHAHLAGSTSGWGTIAAPGWGVAAAAFDDAHVRSEIQAQLDRTARECRMRARALDVAAVVAEGQSPFALVDAANTVDAELLVVGSSGLGPLLRAMFGSTAADLTDRTDRPVVVVHDHPAAEGPVVVGVDGTGASLPALRFAFDHALRHRCRLHVVHSVSGVTSDLIASTRFSHNGSVAQPLSDEFLGAWRDLYPTVPVEVDVVDERPVDALLRRSAQARLLVVGGRRSTRRSFSRSVSRAAIHRASCPVAVIPGTRLATRTQSVPAPRGG
ncbi:universal stress protein [Lentzea sp. NPDC034063]|uniref:universal stress protein n=1 Tax=unclassified Lentzea TaxID=2643253 RepID=UPI0033CFB222